MQPINTPYNRDQIKELPKGFTTTCVGPNRRDRRIERQAGSNMNARQTRGRKVQKVQIFTKVEMPFGPVRVATGFFRRIVHKVAAIKERVFAVKR